MPVQNVLDLRKDLDGFGRRVPLQCERGISPHDLERQLKIAARGFAGELPDQSQAHFGIARAFAIGRACECGLCRGEPASYGRLDETAFRIMMGNGFRCGLPLLAEMLRQRPRDIGMDVLLSTAQKRRVSCLLHEGVLENVVRRRRCAATVNQPRIHQLGQCIVQCRPCDGRDELQETIGKLARDRGSYLSDLPYRRQTIQPGHQRVLQGRWDRNGVSAAATTYDPFFSVKRPDSSTVFVSSSTNRGTPSALVTISSRTSAGNPLLPVSCSIIESECRRPKRFRDCVVT